MHGSHKLWIMIAVFMVVIAFLLSMYFTATPEDMGKVIDRRKAVEEKKREMKDILRQKKQGQQETADYQVDAYETTVVEAAENSEENKMEKYEEEAVKEVQTAADEAKASGEAVSQDSIKQ